MQSYAPLGERPGFVPAPAAAATTQSRFPLPAPGKLARLVLTPGPAESTPLVPPMLRPGPGSAARFILLYTLGTWVCTFALNLPWLPWLLYLDYGTPIFQGAVPVWWLYLQTANFTFWNVLAVTAADDYFTHDCVDALRRLGVPHDRRSPAYKAACGWWPRELVPRTLKVTAAATALFGGLPLVLFLATPPYHKEHCSKLGFVAWVTLWSSAVGAALCTLVQVRAAGEGTSSPLFFKTDTRLCFQPLVFRLAWVISGAEAEMMALTRPSSLAHSLDRSGSDDRLPGELYADLPTP